MASDFLIEYLEQYFDEIDYKSFYRAIFPQGEFQDLGQQVQGQYNGILVEVSDKKTTDSKGNEKNVVFRHTLTDELSKLDEVVQRDNFCLMSPISYAGKSRSSINARVLYAITIDLDGLIVKPNDKFSGISTLFHQIENVGRIPKPTYIVASGTGLHLYYVLDKPIKLFPNVVQGLQKFKRELTRIVWQGYITEFEDKVQYESLFQGFRVVGTITKNGKRARAFEIGKKVSMDYLNDFVSKDFKATELSYKGKFTLAEAKAKFPEWYEERIVKGAPKGTWTTKRAVYDWWKAKVLEGAQTGHRYYCLMMLCIYAKKAGIGQEELEKDAFEMGEYLATLPAKADNPFHKGDVLNALEAYNDRYMTFPITSIEHITDIRIEKNKRNFRKQAEHIKLMNFVRDEINHNDNWRNKEGRPKGSGTAQERVQEWRRANPNGRKVDCHSETKLSRVTINKWWESVDTPIIN